MRDSTDPAAFEGAIEIAARLRRNVETVVLGKSETVTLVVAALASRGHVVLGDVPGTAKTVLARAVAGRIQGLARASAASFEGAAPARIRCTPDVQPTDITGLSIWNPQTRTFEFRAGPVF